MEIYPPPKKKQLTVDRIVHIHFLCFSVFFYIDSGYVWNQEKKKIFNNPPYISTSTLFIEW